MTALAVEGHLPERPLDSIMTAGNLFASFIFGTIGLAAFVYGKKAQLWKPMAIGVVLMVYPYFIADTVGMTLVGCALTAGLFVFRD